MHIPGELAQIPFKVDLFLAHDLIGAVEDVARGHDYLGPKVCR
ncbi:unnamed protein product [Acidithrix sp. C25]|nr:unnamed protein product [Acidithrix sp. C25]